MADLMKNGEMVDNDLTRGEQGVRIAANDKEYNEFLDCISVILLGYASYLKEKGEMK